MRSEGILNTIFNEDCLITMSRIESGTVDLILQDPPYGTTGNEWDIIPDFKVMWEEWERTTAHACINEKRNYIGSEMNEQFYKLLNERLEREYSQPKLF